MMPLRWYESAAKDLMDIGPDGTVKLATRWAIFFPHDGSPAYVHDAKDDTTVLAEDYRCKPGDDECDIIERLREAAKNCADPLAALLIEAANEIEHLRDGFGVSW